MRKEDIEKLLVGGITAACIALYVLFVRLNSMVDVKYLAVAVFLLLNLAVIPRFVQMYYKYHELQIGGVRFVPLYNYYLVFGKAVSVILTVTIGLALACFVCSLLPVRVYVSFLDTHTALLVTRFTLHWVFVLLTVIEIEIGIGLCTLLTEIRNELFLRMGVRTRSTDVMMYVALLIPLVRIFPVKVMSDRLSALVQRKTVKQKHKQKLKKEVEYYD